MTCGPCRLIEEKPLAKRLAKPVIAGFVRRDNRDDIRDRQRSIKFEVASALCSGRLLHGRVEVVGHQESYRGERGDCRDAS